MSITQNLCFGDYTLYKGKGAWFMNEGIIIDSFQNLLKDLESIAYSSYICELIDLTLTDEEVNRDVFQDAIKCMYLMKNNVGDIEVIARAFEIKIIKYAGYNIILNRCTKCGKSIKMSKYFDIKNLGAVCDSCGDNMTLGISGKCYSAMVFLSNLSIENIYKVNLNEQIKKELYKINNILISEVGVRKPKSLEILKLI
jgi:DNA repair protein RecO (recombination protein O)